MADPMSWVASERLHCRYVCSDCWGELWVNKVGDDLYNVHCQTRGCTTPGFVSKRSAEWRMRKGDEYLYLAKKALRKSIPWMKQFDSQQTQESIFKQLGYKEI